ncbi:MAG: AzlD domain-containing protein [Eubacterium sp.]|nr:AzlD domain-containing protein [Eubacterium sp.]
MSVWIYILVMAVVTYLIRMLPFTLIRGKVRSRFLRSLLYYIPYAVLAAMTFPSIFYATGNTATAVVGTVTALLLAWFRMPLIVVALAAAGAAFAAGMFL